MKRGFLLWILGCCYLASYEVLEGKCGKHFFEYLLIPQIFLYGGYSKEISSDKSSSEKGIVHSDMWSLDPRTWEWNKVCFSFLSSTGIKAPLLMTLLFSFFFCLCGWHLTFTAFGKANRVSSPCGLIICVIHSL